MNENAFYYHKPMIELYAVCDAEFPRPPYTWRIYVINSDEYLDFKSLDEALFAKAAWEKFLYESEAGE